jgi:hypothetical protein
LIGGQFVGEVLLNALPPGEPHAFPQFHIAAKAATASGHFE